MALNFRCNAIGTREQGGYNPDSVERTLTRVRLAVTHITYSFIYLFIYLFFFFFRVT